jgi:hypothetical protein
MTDDVLQKSILDTLTSSNNEWDTMIPTDPDYMMHSPIPVGYNTTSEQRYLMQNLLVGYSGGSLLDIGCGRCDLYDVARNLAELNNDIPLYNAIDHNPIMTQLAEAKWGLTNIYTGAFESTMLPPSQWVVASGVFTQRRCETEDADLKKLFDDIDILYNIATDVVAFNLLNPINNKIHEGFFYVHPGLVMDMLIEKYRFVTVRNNYANDVYTVTIYKF